jgi:hypothetical protein
MAMGKHGEEEEEVEGSHESTSLPHCSVKKEA